MACSGPVAAQEFREVVFWCDLSQSFATAPADPLFSTSKTLDINRPSIMYATTPPLVDKSGRRVD